MLLFPCFSLQELHLCKNAYKSVDFGEDDVFPSVTDLQFHYNQVTEWSEISKLGRAFPNLEKLVLLGNPLVSLGDEEGMTIRFAHLRSIHLVGTQINDWREIDKLRHLPKLSDVRIHSVPLLEVSSNLKD